MSTLPICEKCGAVNTVGANFCSNCANPLVRAAQPVREIGPTVGVGSGIPYRPRSYARFFPDERTREMGRTRTGLLLIMFGTIMGPLPYANYLGGILAIVGAILVILGRKAFGETHSRNTVWSIGIYVLGTLIVIVGSFAFLSDVTSAPYNAGVNGTTLTQYLTSSFEGLLVTAAVGAAIIGVANVLFTYALQNRNGRVLLWCAYAAGIAVAIVEFSIISPLISNFVSQTFTGGTYDPAPLRTLQGQLQAAGLLGFIPAALYAAAYYLAWSRIDEGQVISSVEQSVNLPKPGPFGKPP